MKPGMKFYQRRSGIKMFAALGIFAMLCATIVPTIPAHASDQVATDAERATQVSVGEEDDVPLYAGDIANGVYENVEVESSSSMFRIVDCTLTVEDDAMRAVLTLGGTGYLRLYMGTGEEAVAADESAYSEFVENADGQYTYDVAISALDAPLECTGFSARKEKWYDHQISVRSASLPDGAVLAETAENAGDDGDAEVADGAGEASDVATTATADDASATDSTAFAKIDLPDGNYTVEVSMSGGTGRASITSPTDLMIGNKQAVAVITFSSPNYDYMLVDGKKYTPVNVTGNSTFRIPVLTFDEPFEVIADTTAMSEPHEITYELTFDSGSIQSKPTNALTERTIYVIITLIGCVMIVLIGVFYAYLRKRREQDK